MSERNLARFRASPEKVRVALRPNKGGWVIAIQSRVNDYRYYVAVGSNDRLTIARAMMDALMWCYQAKMQGIDPYMDWAYEHPHNVNQYNDTHRIDEDNELMGLIGLVDHANTYH